MRVSLKNVQARVELYGDMIEKLTGEHPELSFTKGSSTYGNQFRLQHIVRDETGEAVNYKPFWGSYDGNMGFTRREAWDTLGATICTLGSVMQFMS